ncbi:MAG TPA: Ig-like domain-containing protein [Solimonas sp.]
MRTFKSVLSLAAALVLSACGGGATLGDGGGGGLGGGGGGTTGPSSTPASVVLLSNRQQLSADADTATEGATLTAIVTDRNGIAVSNAPVTFSVVSGAGALIISSGTTGADGTATAILTTGGNASFPRSIEVRARAGSAQSELRSIAVVDPNSVSAVPNVSLAASSNRLDPNADSTAAGVTLTATVRNPDGTPASNVRVNFNQASTSGGLISPSEGRTNGAGQIQAVLTTGGDPSPRSIVITAQVTNLTDGSGGAESVPVTIQVRSTQTATSVGLSANRNVLSPTANSPDQGITVTATVAGPNGQALVGVPVTFSASGVVLQVTQAVTDGSGRATAIATAGGNATPRTATVTASADGVNSSPLAIQVRSAASLTLTSTSDQLSPRAETPAQGIVFTATLRDASGTPLPNVQVQFIAEGGQIQVTRGVTDAAGTATAVLTTGGDPSPRTILVTAGATDGGQILEATRSISVVEQAAGVVVLAASPDLQSNVSVPANGVRITAVVRDSNNTLVQNAAVQFSTVSGGGALQVTRGITDVTGTAEALLSTGGDPTVRPITVRAQSGASSGTVSVQVVGSQVTINAPQAASVGVAETIVVSVRDSGNAVVANRPVTLSSTALLGTINGSSGSATVNSNAQGVATFTYLPTANGDERLTATAIGVSAQTPTIRIGGVTLTLAFNPGTPTEFNFGTVANVVATLRENGVAVSGETLQLSTTRGMLSAASGVTAPPRTYGRAVALHYSVQWGRWGR